MAIFIRCFAGFFLISGMTLRLAGQVVWQPVVLTGEQVWAEGTSLPANAEAWLTDPDYLARMLAPFPVQPGRKLVLPLPLPDGRKADFLIEERPVMAMALAERYPEIRTFAGRDLADPRRKIRCEWGPAGFSAMITRPGEETVHMDPLDRRTGQGPMILYGRSAYVSPTLAPFVCHGPERLAEEAPENPDRSGESDGLLRIYRLALACTGEYGAYHGGTVNSVLAAMATTINRINGIYERDFGIRLELVADNDQLIFVNGATDPFDNSSLNTMLGQNQTLCNNVIGNANYDVGHVFGTQGGGLATLNSPCNANAKARGATGLSNPKGDVFDVDYVAHELGHQFGCNHTFNNACSGNRNPPTAWEPGSGSTIMGYAGVCDPNVQGFSDPYFHAGSLTEAYGFIVNGNGNSCPEKIPGDNQAPVVNAGPDLVIPHSTPFELEAISSDPDGDTLTYAWEQMDNQVATMPPESENATGPLFRSYTPSLSPVRVFPRLSAILANLSPTWEVLPSAGRLLRFRVTARDEKPGYGRWAQDAVVLTVDDNAGPFRVTHPDTNIEWWPGDTVDVTWEVAGTDLPPVNSPEVNIFLSVNGGTVYADTLAKATPNDGHFRLLVPHRVSNQCRVKIKGTGHVFFDLSNQHFRIAEPPFPSFLAHGLTDSLAICRAGGDTFHLEIALRAMSGFQDSLTIAPLVPAGFSTDLPDRLRLDGTDTLRFKVWYEPGAHPDEQIMTIGLSGLGITRSLVYRIHAFDPVEGTVNPVYPADLQDSIPAAVVLTWNPVPGASMYEVEISESPSFPDPVQRMTAPDTLLPVSLNEHTVYYWRVRPLGACPYEVIPPTWTFRTLLELCRDYQPDTLPLTIPDDQPILFTSLIPVVDKGTVTRVAVTADVTHSDLGDLTLRLLSPPGSGLNLVAKACPGLQDVLATFTQDGEPFSCSGGQPAVSGVLKPQTGAMSLFAGFPASGNWGLRVVDDAAGDGGALNTWTLTLCRRDALPPPPDIAATDTLEGRYHDTAVADSTLIVLAGGDGNHVTVILHQSPAEGELLYMGQTLLPGDAFPYSALKAGEIGYRHYGGPVLTDSFRVDLLDTLTHGWSPGHFIPVSVRTALEVVVSEASPVSCAGAADGVLGVTFTGGKPPYSYRILPSGNWQETPFFEGLPAGSYTLEARDSNGFVAAGAAFLLEEPEPLVLSVVLQGDTLRLSAQGGTLPYLYQLETDTSSTGAFPVDAPGFHAATVTDARGCTTEWAGLVAFLEAQVDVVDALCKGSLNGEIRVMAIGGHPPYRYRLDGGVWQSDPVFSGLSAGMYNVWVADSSPFEKPLGPFAVNEPDSLILTGFQTGDGEVTLFAGGGTPPYVFGLEQGSLQDSAVFAGLSNGPHAFLVEDLQGCRDTLVVDVMNTSVDGTPGPGRWRVYPNPAGASFVVEGPDGGAVTWRLVDVLGREVGTGLETGNTWVVESGWQPAGWYLLLLEGRDGRQIVRIRLTGRG